MAEPTVQAAHEGMGAIVHEGGVAFRVWAPNADEVAVIGSFNNFDNQRHPMTREENGTWYLDIREAKAGDEYRYFIRNGEQELSRIDPYAHEVTNSVGNGVIHDPAFDWGGDDELVMPPWNEAVIYELHIGTFVDSKGDKPGNFCTALNRLHHLKKLGVNVIQVMPAGEFAGDYSWGYNPAHIFSVESVYGGPRAFKNFVKKCHEVGIAVILDVVYNHFGPSDLDLWQFDGWSENDGGGIYFYNDWKAESPWGSTRPDYGRGEVRTFIRDNALYWLEQFHVDGLRWDMTLYIRTVRGNETSGDEQLPDGWSLMAWVNQEVKEKFPGALTIAEDLQKSEWITKDEGAGGANFGSQWDAAFVHPVRAAVITPEDADRDMNSVAEAIQFNYEGSMVKRVVYTESHDEVANGSARVPSEISPDEPHNWFAQKRSTLGGALVFTVPGIPMIFQGQEFMEPEWFRDTVPLDWSLDKEFRGIVRLYHDLIWMRLNKGGFTRGLTGEHVNVFHVDNDAKVIAFHRWMEGGPGDDVVVIMNFANNETPDYTIGLPSAGLWKVRLNSDWDGYSDQFGNFQSYDVSAGDGGSDGLASSGVIGLGPYSVVILSQDAPEG